MKETEIAWTDSTFNPWWGCVKISDGCKHCYAETFDRRVHGIGKGHWGLTADHRRFGAKHWNEPRRWNEEAAKSGKPWRVFCASMADVFEGRGEDDADRARLMRLIVETPALTWLLLTKRPENMVRLGWPGAWPRNVWAGCTVEDQQNADRRGPELLRVPAAVRFLSVEPMLGPVDLDRHLWGWGDEFNARGVDWVIVGGESGHGARPFDLRWAASIADQCHAAGVPYFFKQAGALPLVGDDRIDLKNRKGGDLDELARRVPWLAERGVFRREWPPVEAAR